MENEFFTRKEAAEFFSVTPLTLWKWMRDGKLMPATRNAGSGKVQYLISDCIEAKEFKPRPKKKTTVNG
jgi:predicted site-specific integrase-resolvase